MQCVKRWGSIEDGTVAMENKRLGKSHAAYRSANASKQLASRLASSRKRTTSNDSPDDHIQKQSDPIGTGTVTCSALNVRNGAGTNYERIGGLTKGKSVQVYEKKSGWLRIKYGTGFGWVCGDYVKYAKSEISADGVPLYGQGDPEWGGDYMGSSGKTISEIGCTMTSSTMVLNKMSGKSFTPKDMNNYLNNHGGYEPGGGLRYYKAGEYVNKTAELADLDIGMIDTCLESGRPVVVRVPGHYVCVAGRKADGSYIIHEPKERGSKKSAVWDGSAFKVEGYDPATQLIYFY